MSETLLQLPFYKKGLIVMTFLNVIVLSSSMLVFSLFSSVDRVENRIISVIRPDTAVCHLFSCPHIVLGVGVGRETFQSHE